MMILYKYVPFEAGRKIIETGTLGFSQPKYFNDPFDLPVYPQDLGEPMATAAFRHRLRVMGKEFAWGEHSGVLSLTRTPTNALMWAHYADKHTGMVIGIDVAAAGLTDEAHNLIPAQYGSVIYVSRRPSEPFIGRPATGLEVGSTHHFPRDHYEKLQRLFLHKPTCWSYEEEVRVVKCLRGIAPDGGETASGKFQVAEVGKRPLHLLEVPRDAIREIHFGFRADIREADEFYYLARDLVPHVSIRECHLLPELFSVGAREYITIAEHLDD